MGVISVVWESLLNEKPVWGITGEGTVGMSGRRRLAIWSESVLSTLAGIKRSMFTVSSELVNIT